MEQDTEELEEKVDKLLVLTADTNHLMHGIRRSQRWGHFFTILWWVFIVGSSAAAYYYLQPYTDQVVKYYKNFQSGSQQAQSFEQEVAQYFQKHFTATSTQQ